MYEVAHALAAACRWLLKSIRPKRLPTNHHRREAKEQ